MDNEFDSYLTARNHYRKYKESWEDPTIVDETENSPFGIYASIIRYQPGELDDSENASTTDFDSEDNWDDLDALLDELKREEF